MLLVIDTSLGTAVAVVDHERGVLAARCEAGTDTSPPRIGELIKNILEEASTDPAALSGVALGIGPGSDSRLAIGAAVAHGFAAALKRPVVRVLTHDSAVLDRQEPAVVVTRLDADHLAWTAYGRPDSELGLPVRVTEPALTNVVTMEAADEAAGLERTEVREVDAGALGMLAERLYAGGRTFARKQAYSFEALAQHNA